MVLRYRRCAQSEKLVELLGRKRDVLEADRLRQCQLLYNREMHSFSNPAGLEIREHLYCNITAVIRMFGIRSRMGMDYACAIYDMGMRKQGYSADVEYEQQRKKNRDYYVP